MLDKSIAEKRDEILKAANDGGLMSRPAWRLMHQSKHYEECPRAPFTIAESLAEQLINLPSSAGLA